MRLTAFLWMFVLALLAFAIWALSPVYAETTACGHPVADVGVYALIAECTVDLTTCRRQPARRFEDFDGCRRYVAEVAAAEPTYDGLPLIMGRCMSWSPPIDWRRPSR